MQIMKRAMAVLLSGFMSFSTISTPTGVFAYEEETDENILEIESSEEEQETTEEDTEKEDLIEITVETDTVDTTAIDAETLEEAPDEEVIDEQEVEEDTDEEEVDAAAPAQMISTYALGGSDILDLLEGDYAKLKSFGFSLNDKTESGYAISTGTEPWDANDDPGNDSSQNNNVVRSFDSVTYSLNVQTSLQPEAKEEGITAFKEGTMYFEFILPAASDKALFDTDAMGWLSGYQEAVYEVVEETINGVTCQVLRGSFLSVPNSDNPAAIGASFNSLNVAIRVLAMHQGDTIKPTFTMWLKDNEVGTTYSGDFSGIPQSIVTGSGAKCEKHGTEEYLTVEAPEITVSAAPRYNVAVRNVSDRTNALGSFDFSTGNELAQNKDAGVQNGRMMSYAITVTIEGKDGYGLKGVELPDESTPITFDIRMSGDYQVNGKSGYVVDSGYQPIFWQGEGHNSKTLGADGRYCGPATSMLNGYPYNKTGANSSENSECSIYNGGDWVFNVDEDDNSLVHVTISNYEVDLTKIPRTHAGWGSGAGHYEFVGSQEKREQYWTQNTIYLSCGEMRILMPLYSTEDGTFISEKLGSGTNRINIYESNISMKSVTGIEVTSETQTKKTDDETHTTVPEAKPGTYSSGILWYSNDYKVNKALTDGCGYNGQDWAVENQGAGISAYIYMSNAEENNVLGARDLLVKFDDAVYNPQSVGKMTNTSSYVNTFLYGAKPDGSGWDHKGLEPEDSGYDTEMILATADDLVWYKSIDDLKAEGKVCVAVLDECRGIRRISNDNINMRIYGEIKENTAGHVYMNTINAISWRLSDVAAAAAEYADVDESALTDEQYTNYLLNEFPSKADGTAYADYPKATFVKSADDSLASSATADIFNKLQKAYYENGVYCGEKYNRDYQDSVLIVPVTANITKNVAQTNTDGSDKKVFDMGQNQRVVDFVLNPSIERSVMIDDDIDAEYTTTITIVDTLPVGLTYITGSGYWDKDGTAEYTQGYRQQSQGKVTGAEAIQPDVDVDANGKITLTWTLENITFEELKKDTVAYPGRIWYSCEIGTPGNEDTDVKNQQQLTNTVTISTPEDNRVKNLTNRNMAVSTIEVLKQPAFSLSKTADQPVVDVSEDIGFTINIGNNSAQDISNALIMDSLPYNEDGRGTSFDGEIYLTEVVAKKGDAELYTNLRFFYTTNEEYRGQTSETLIGQEYTARKFEESEDWTELTLSDDITAKMFTDLPEVSEQKGDNQIVALVIVGDIPAQKTIKIGLTVRLSNPKTGDNVVNQLTDDTLESYARTVVGERRLSGLAWFDKNYDGKRVETEDLLPGTKVTLLKLNDNDEYEVVKYTDATGTEHDATITTGNQLNLLNGTVAAIEGHTAGSYMFTMLPQGTFAVRFEDADGSWTENNYSATKQDATKEEVYDSDAEGTYNGTTLTQTQISGIVMPASKDMRSAIYESKNNDSGFANTSLSVTKEWDDEENRDGKRPSEVKVQLYADGEPYGDSQTIDAEEGSYTWNKLPVISDGEEIVYTVAEVDVDENYESDATEDEPAEFEDGAAVITNKHEPEKTEIKVAKIWNDEETDLKDGKGYERPEVIFNLTGTIEGKEEPVYEGEIALNEDNRWEYTFEDLYVYEDGKEITYTVTEEEVDGYEAGEPSKNEETGTIEITNTPEEDDKYNPVEITIKKTDTLDGSDLNGAKFTVTDEEENESVTEATSEGTVTFEFTEPGAYTIKESVAPTGYELNENSYVITVVKSTIKSAELVDGVWVKEYDLVFAEDQPEEFESGTLEVKDDPIMTEVPVKKIWNDEETDLKDGEGYERPEVIFSLTGTIEGKEEPVYEDEITLNEDNEWKYTFENLRAYAEYKEITYTVTEEVPEGYEGGDAVKNAEGTVEITNTPKETIEITSITLTIVKTDETGEKNLSGAKFTVTDEEENVTELEATDEEGTVTFEFTAAGTYTIKEIEAPVGFELSDKEYVITVEETEIVSAYLNEDKVWVKVYDLVFAEDQPEEFVRETLTVKDDPILTEVTVKKIWADENDADGLRDKYGVTLYADGVAVEEVILKKNELTYTWTGLHAYKDGELIVYTVDETTVPKGYTKSVKGNAEEGFEITNSHTVTPDTGDHSSKGMWTMMFFGSLTLMGGLLLAMRKRREAK